MELQINDLVSSIKKEGIDAANAKADEIISDAEQKARSIIEQAKQEAERIKTKGENEARVLKESAQLDAEHAQRDAVLSFKKSVQNEFEKILSAETEKQLDSEMLATLIRAAIGDENPADYAVEVADVTESINNILAEEIKNGLEIRPSERVRMGFKLAAKDGSGYFDCSDDEITEMLQPFFPETNK